MEKENYLQAATNSVNKLRPLIQGINFSSKSYNSHKHKNKLIYCDPPYQQTKFPIKYRTGVKKYDVFDNKEFWEIMKNGVLIILYLFQKLPHQMICMCMKKLAIVQQHNLKKQDINQQVIPMLMKNYLFIIVCSQITNYLDYLHHLLIIYYF